MAAASASIEITAKPSWTSYFFLTPLLFRPWIFVDERPAPRPLWFRPIRVEVAPGRHRISVGVPSDDAWIDVDVHAGEETVITYTTPRTKVGRGRYHLVAGVELARDDDTVWTYADEGNDQSPGR